MRRSLLVGCALLLSTWSCEPHTATKQGWEDPVTGLRLVVEAEGGHSQLRDHERVLFVVRSSGGVSRVGLYPDTGAGAITNLYRRDKGGLVLVDENGVWITVLESGDIESVRWRWQTELPSAYLGTFQAGPDQVYSLVVGDEPEIYRHKDPPEGIPSELESDD